MFLNDHGGAKRGRFDQHHSAAPAYGGYGAPSGASSSYGGYSGAGGGGRGDMPPCNTLFIGNLSDQVQTDQWAGFTGAWYLTKPLLRSCPILTNRLRVFSFVEDGGDCQ